MNMVSPRVSARTLSAHKASESRLLLLPIKMLPELRHRFKIACAEEGMTYSQLIAHLLDEREKTRNRQRAQQVSPLHPARKNKGAVSGYPGGSHNA